MEATQGEVIGPWSRQVCAGPDGKQGTTAEQGPNIPGAKGKKQGCAVFVVTGSPQGK